MDELVTEELDLDWAWTCTGLAGLVLDLLDLYWTCTGLVLDWTVPEWWMNNARAVIMSDDTL